MSEKVHIRRENVASDGYFAGADWRDYRKVATTRMMPWSGAAVIETKEGKYELPDYWEGFIAIDADGVPYSVEKAIHDASYELVVNPQ